MGRGHASKYLGGKHCRKRWKRAKFGQGTAGMSAWLERSDPGGDAWDEEKQPGAKAAGTCRLSQGPCLLF